MSPKTVGIIGGLGPMATVAFMNSVLEHTPIKSNRDHLHMIVDCNPKVPDINAAILGTGPSAAAALAAGGRRLETAGADLVVMVCNAAHVYEDELRRAVAVPFISMIEETVRTIRSDTPQCRRVGLLATDGCLRSNLYQERLASVDLIPVLQTDDELGRLMLALSRITAGDISHAIRFEILGLIDALAERGAETVVLACSEIALVGLDAGIDVPVIDPCLVLAKTTVRTALGG
ncbi:amino acid racemase [Mesorhizobium sp. M0187]|uniref:aspartate/glutamate racemase family protein n=1 Tax=Mesorhizobium sp. M0187 TaxID=2956908 RepID=UPI003335CB58